jgi:8-oxo-dGTP pyrophosphatase MutT (NUDIX family)
MPGDLGPAGELPQDEGRLERRFRQFIPRPPHAVAGGLAPWAHLPAGERCPLALGDAVAGLSTAVVPASLEPDLRPHAAVLVPLFEREGDTVVVLIRRSLLLFSNPGDLAFPGGRLEPGERAVDAALREAEEEVALDPALVSVLGRLPIVNRARGDERVVPYIGVLTAEPALRSDPSEVDAIFTVALSDLAADGVYWEEEWPIPGQDARTLPFFADVAALGNDVIWGMTAMVIRQVLSAALIRGERSGIA